MAMLKTVQLKSSPIFFSAIKMQPNFFQVQNLENKMQQKFYVLQ